MKTALIFSILVMLLLADRTQSKSVKSDSDDGNKPDGNGIGQSKVPTRDLPLPEADVSPTATGNNDTLNIKMTKDNLTYEVNPPDVTKYLTLVGAP